MIDDLIINKRLTLPAKLLTISTTRSSGPGGQHVNKVATRVVLRFDPDAWDALSPGVVARLRRLAGPARMDGAGVIVLSSQETRSQHRNMADVQARLAALIRGALVPPRRRKATRPTRGSVERRLQAKRRNADKKKGRGQRWD